LKGDRNTAYFHTIANHRMTKERIECLQGSEGLVYDTHEILGVAAGFYKNLFKWESSGSVSLEADFWGPGELVAIDEM
jgi:hypothetical protein